MQYFAHIPDFDDETKLLEQYLGNLARHAAKIAHTHYSNRFIDQNWDGVPWRGRRAADRGKQRAILIKDGNLRDSIRFTSVGNVAIINTDAAYAQIHNEGGEITVTVKMQKYFWAMYYQAKDKIQTKKDGTERKNKANAAANEDMDTWKWLALKKVGEKITIPKRQFMDIPGSVPSAALRDDINDFVKAQLDKILKP